MAKEKTPATPVVVTRDGAPREVVQRVEGTLYRALDAAASIESEEDRIIVLSFSSETPYTRYSFFEDPWVETLGHDEGEVDLSRLNNRAPLLYNHSRTRQDRIGSILEAWVENGRGYARAQLSRRADIEDIWQDVRDGHLANVSVGYMIHERKLTQENNDGPDEYRVTRWEPLENSLVDIPADPTVGVGRSVDPDHVYRVIDITNRSDNPEPSTEETQMTEKTKEKPTGKDPAASDTNTRNEADLDKVREEARQAALRDERNRQTEVRAAFEHVDYAGNAELRELREKCLQNPDMTAERAGMEVLKEIGKGKTPSGPTAIQPGEDRTERFAEGVERALLVRSGDPSIDARAETANEFRGLSLIEISRKALEVHGLPSGGARLEAVGRALTMRSGIGHSTSDFPSILANVANKSMLRGYNEAEETWALWCRTGNLSDFKAATRFSLSAFADLDQVREGGEYKYGTFSDRGETIQLATYGKIFPITRQAIINDDMQAFTRIPANMGRAAARVPGDLAYAVLTTNPTMADGTVLFHADHNNLGTSGVISATSVSEARQLMAKQTDVSGSANGLNIRLGVLIVPVALEDTALVLRDSEYDPASTTNSRAPNPVRRTFEVAADPRLDASSVAQWYAAAGAAYDTVEVAFLDGNQDPRIEEQTGWTVDGVEYKVALDCAAAAMDHRTLVRNAGT